MLPAMQLASVNGRNEMADPYGLPPVTREKIRGSAAG